MPGKEFAEEVSLLWKGVGRDSEFPPSRTGHKLAITAINLDKDKIQNRKSDEND